MEYICYLSPRKVADLHSQTSDVDVVSVSTAASSETSRNIDASTSPIIGLLKGGLTFGARERREATTQAAINTVQKLVAVVDRLEQQGRVDDLNAAIDRGSALDGTKFFAYRGSFRCEQGGFEPELAAYVDREHDAALADQPHQGTTVLSSMAVLHSQYAGFDIRLACSIKYFSDMGGERSIGPDGMSEHDTVTVTPHSGNWHFFDGQHAADFRAVLVLTGQRRRQLFGSPLVLVNNFSPDFII
jgi:hypothetical protein